MHGLQVESKAQNVKGGVTASNVPFLREKFGMSVSTQCSSEETGAISLLDRFDVLPVYVRNSRGPKERYFQLLLLLLRDRKGQ